MEANNKIQILSETLTNQIAAGEVVDRPASVVKELVENSIDAGARNITIVLKDGGKSLIQIVDDGSGMTQSDAVLSVQRHATSKIASLKDLECITTLGFRGEALASIASVARFEMRSAVPEASEGTFILVEGGVMHKVETAPATVGTSIAVKNIFFNTPARRKFLRADNTEYRHILGMINRFTLAFPEIAFTLINDGEEIFNFAAATLEKRMGDVMGSFVRKHLIPITDESSLLKVNGYLGNYDIVRKSRGEQYLFLNKRFINDRILAHAIFSGYGDAIPKGAYPVYVLFLEINPDRVDVNVHPTKSEVRFADQKIIYDLVRGAVKRALSSDAIIPEIRTPATGTAPMESFREQWNARQTRINFSGFQRTSPELGARAPLPNAGPAPWDFDADAGPSAAVTPPPRAAADSADEPTLTSNVWQVHNKYILAQVKNGLVLIDQHVAHERILFERALKGFKESQPASQRLLFPQTIELTPEDYSYFTEMQPFLEKIGFQIKVFSKNTIVVEGAPAGFRVKNEEKILLDIIEEYKNDRYKDLGIHERVAASFSCRSAIMAGDRLGLAEMNLLIDQLFATENPYFCPHGRPIIVNISLEELDKRFERA